jgi:hypothetical protein
VEATASRKEGLGYSGLPSGIVVEFDFGSTLSHEDPTYPHVSVQYRSDGKGPLSPHHSFSIAYSHIPYELLNSHVHNIRIVYRREINQVNFRSDNFLVSIVISSSLVVHGIRIALSGLRWQVFNSEQLVQ